MRLIHFLTLALFAGGAIAQTRTSGQKLFEAQCALCHGQGGGGGKGPSLQRPTLAKAPDDAALAKVIAEGLPPEMPGAWQLSPSEVKELSAYVRSLGRVAPEVVPGDPGVGRKVYLTTGCQGCHIINGEGSGSGPELTDIGLRRNAAHLRESIVRPEAALPEGFAMIEAVPLVGKAITGVRIAEDPFTVQLRDSRGQYVSLRKASLKTLTRMTKRSPMPAFDKLSGKGLEDLVAYLASLKGAQQ